MEQKKLEEILEKHAKWLRDEEGGECAYLSDANLRGSILCGAELRDAELCGAELDNSEIRRRMIVPEVGEFTAFKKLYGGYICELKVPAHAKRLGGLTERKCRVSEAVVIRITDKNGIGILKGVSGYDKEFEYAIGETVKVDNFCDDARMVCASGIHCFITRIEAEEYR